MKFEALHGAGYDTPMQTLLEFAPLIAFLVAYQQAGIYVATATLMIAMVALLLLDLARTRRIAPMHGISTALVMLFGGATLLLHDERFIIWKPTVFFWVLGIAFLASGWIAQRSLAERLMTAATPDAFAGVPASGLKQRFPDQTSFRSRHPPMAFCQHAALHIFRAALESRHGYGIRHHRIC